MFERRIKNHVEFIALVLTALLVLSGCYPHRGGPAHESPPSLRIGRVVVIGFRPALGPEAEPGPTRSPISGAVFMAEPTKTSDAALLTESLFSKLISRKNLDLVSPGQAKGVFSSIIQSDSAIGDIEAARKIGRAFTAKSVLLGHLYRWKEREGTDYAVNFPASVAFDLYLVSVESGKILWKGKYDKTQTSLSENLLDMNTFLKGKGKWMTARALAEIGLEKMLERFPREPNLQESP